MKRKRQVKPQGRRVTVEGHLVNFVEEVQVSRNLANFNRALNFILSESIYYREHLLAKTSLIGLTSSATNSPQSVQSLNESLIRALDALG